VFSVPADGRAREAALDSEERFRLLVESSPNALLMVDRQGTISLWNRQAEVLFGYAREEIIGKCVELLLPSRVREEHVMLRRGFLNAPSQRPMGAGRDLFAQRKDGSEVPVEIGLTPIQMPDGLFILATITDITQRKQAEELLRRSEERFRKLSEDLRRSNEELGQFASMVSHDLQQPLVVISSYLNLLKRRLGDKVDPESREFIDVADESARNMQGMVRGMLEYARAARTDKPMSSTDMNEVFQQALANLQEEIKRHPATITHDPLPTVQCDPMSLVQVYQNLCGNALKFRSPDRPLTIHAGCRPESSGWLLWVQDNGIGMDPDQASQVFEAFFQVNPQGVYPGTGLGLTICKKIIERHGGRIWAESQPDQGATFLFTLPER